MDSCTLSVGAANQTLVPSIVHNLPSTIPPNGAVNSNLITAQGYSKIAVGLVSSQNGILSIYRFLDLNGAVPVGTPATVNLVAGTPAALTVNDGQVFSSFEIVITNAANTTALLGNTAVAVATDPASQTVPSSGSYTTASSASVSVPSTTGGTIVLPQNLNAKFRTFRSVATNTHTIWLTLGANPQVGTGFMDLQPGDVYEMTVADGNLSQGVITAIAETSTQTLLVTEGV